MEKLIIEFDVGDEYTYSATQTVPAIFSSKEEFIITFEDELLKIIEQIKKLSTEKEKYVEKKMNLLHAFQKKQDDKLFSEIQAWNSKIMDVHNKINELSELNIGQQNFYIENFYEREHISLPRVYTIEEYFSSNLKH